MAESERPWSKDLRANLEKVLEHYTPDRYPATIDTQRDYDQMLYQIAEKYSDRLENLAKERRHDYREDYPKREIQRLDAEERKAWDGVTKDETYWAIRDAQLPERKAIERGEFTESERFKEGMNTLAEQHTQDQQKADRAFDQVTSILDERFGLSREREQERDYDRDR